jgi:hypothetical protein
LEKPKDEEERMNRKNNFFFGLFPAPDLHPEWVGERSVRGRKEAQ